MELKSQKYTIARTQYAPTCCNDIFKGDSDLSVHEEWECGNEAYISEVTSSFQCGVSGPLKADCIDYRMDNCK